MSSHRYKIAWMYRSFTQSYKASPSFPESFLFPVDSFLLPCPSLSPLFLCSVSVLSINDGLGSLSAAIERCVLDFFFLPQTCLTLQFTTALIRALAIFPLALFLSPASSLPFIKSQLLHQRWSPDRDSVPLSIFVCVCLHPCVYSLYSVLSVMTSLQTQLVK